MKYFKTILLTAVKILVIYILAALLYLMTPAVNIDPTALQSTDSVTVTETDRYIFLDGYGAETALAFYPGARVEPAAYCAMLKQVAAQGIDCYILKIPLNLSILDINAASSVISAYPYQHWYIGGHSLGAVVSGYYYQNHKQDIDGMILVSGYLAQDISQDNVRVLTLVGDSDGLATAEKLEKYRNNLPQSAETRLIEGGNHAQFGTYGEQIGDNPAAIPGEVQRQLGAAAIVEFLTDD